MKVKTFIRDLRLRAVIGISELERKDRQDLVVNIEFDSDQACAEETDDMARAVDYRALNKDVIALVEGQQHVLIETLAAKIANACLKHDGVQAVRVRLEKPGALRFADSVGVDIERRRTHV
jgi:FolB domain-containing protein